MASLKEIAREYRDEIMDGIAWVAIWKTGRSWNAKAFWLNLETERIEDEEMEEAREIVAADPKAIFINEYYTAHMKKLTSRKLWTAVASFVSMMIVATGGAENTATQVTAIIMAGASVIAYIIGEGLTDAANVGIEEGQLLEADAIKGEDEQ